MVWRLGLYFAGLAGDYLSGAADTEARVQYRAAQLRHAFVAPAAVPRATRIGCQR